MKTGFTCGTFDLLHAGHVLMLKEAREHCDYLIVGLQTDPSLDRPEKRRPIQSLFERMTQLNGCRYVDKIIVYETENDLLDYLQFADIQVRIVGQDHKVKSKSSVRDTVCKMRGIEIYYNKRQHRFSSTELIERIKAV